MANFPLIRPLGWNFLSALASAEMQLFDEQLVKAPNFDEGSSHIPTGHVALTGSFGLRSDYMHVTGSGRLLYTSRQVTREQNIFHACGDNQGSWLIEATGPNTVASWRQDVVGSAQLWWRLQVPMGGVINELHLDVKAGSGHLGLPAVMPSIALGFAFSGQDAWAIAGTAASDTSASVGVYEAGHTISKTGLASSVIAGVTYWARIIGESGANAQDDLRAYNLRTVCAVTSQDEHGT